MCILARSDHEVVRLNVPVNETLGVEELDPGHHLACDHEARLEVETFPAKNEEIL